MRSRLHQDFTLDSASPGTARLSNVAWGLLALGSVLTFAAFMTFDPNPDVVLAFCAATNVAILLWGLHRMYSAKLLLSPMVFFVLSPALLPFYTWGNLGPRIAGPARYNSNPGNLDLYPEVAFLTMFGLLLFCGTLFGPLVAHIRHARIRYEDLIWKPWQAPLTALIAAALVEYLSIKYPFRGGYFVGMDNHLDRWLASTQYFVITLGVLSGVAVANRSRGIIARMLGVSCIVFLLALTLGMRSRTAMLNIVLLWVLCWLTVKPKHARRALVIGGLAGCGIFALGSVVKMSNARGQAESVRGNIRSLMAVDQTLIREALLDTTALDYQYRVAGYDFTAGILQGIRAGERPMYGAGIYSAAVQGLPSFLRPEGTYSERSAIGGHFLGKGLRYDDSSSVQVASGVGDWGVIGGPLIYVVIAVYTVGLWWVSQRSPRLFLAVLIMLSTGVTGMFWDDVFYGVRATGFAWLTLWISGPVLMPRWRPDSGRATKRRPLGVGGDRRRIGIER